MVFGWFFVMCDDTAVRVVSFSYESFPCVVFLFISFGLKLPGCGRVTRSSAPAYHDSMAGEDGSEESE